MPAGTKTLLFGIHNLILHPIFVFIAWLIRYRSLPTLPEFIAICLHDVGLWGLPNIDGKEGEQHPAIMADWLFKKSFSFKPTSRWSFVLTNASGIILGHSRFYAMRMQCPLSKLFQADKLASAIYPSWLYILLGTLSGEIDEYMEHARSGKYRNTGQFAKIDKLTWYLDLRSRLTIMALDRDVEKYMQDKNHWQQGAWSVYTTD